MIARQLRRSIATLQGIASLDNFDVEGWHSSCAYVVRQCRQALFDNGYVDLAEQGVIMSGQAEPPEALAWLRNALSEVERNTTWLTITEAAQVLGYSPSGLRKLVKKGAIRCHQTRPGGWLLFRRDWLTDPQPKALPTAQPKAQPKPYQPKHIR